MPIALLRSDVFQRCPGIIATVLACLATGSVTAGDWSLRSDLEVGETYTDNVNLDPPGQERADLITQVSPRLSLRGRSRRLRLDFDYRMQNLIFMRDNASNTINHQLQANGSAELAQDFLFLDAKSNIGQVVISPEDRTPLTTVTGAGNLSNVATFSISPFVRRDFAGLADTLLQYTYSEVRVERGASDSQSNDIRATLRSGRKFTRLRWSADYQNHQVNRETASDVNFENANGELRYRLSRAFSLLARAGYASNDFETTQATNLDGSFWSVGLAWTPNRYLTLEATYGPRNKDIAVNWTPNVRNSLQVAYRNRSVGLNRGGTWFGRFSHRTRRTQWDIVYEETTTTTQDLLSTEQFVRLSDPATGEIILNPDNQLTLAEQEVFRLTDEVIVRKRLEATVGLRSAKSNVSLRGFHERSEFQLSGEDERRFGATASWAWRFASRTESLLSSSWQRTMFDVNDGTDTLWYLQVGLMRRIRPRLSGSINYTHTQRVSEREGAEYQENRIALLISMSF